MLGPHCNADGECLRRRKLLLSVQPRARQSASDRAEKAMTSQGVRRRGPCRSRLARVLGPILREQWFRFGPNRSRAPVRPREKSLRRHRIASEWRNTQATPGDGSSFRQEMDEPQFVSKYLCSRRDREAAMQFSYLQHHGIPFGPLRASWLIMCVSCL
jgi:hypothetical protein